MLQNRTQIYTAGENVFPDKARDEKKALLKSLERTANANQEAKNNP